MASTESVALARRDRPARPLRMCSIGRLFPMIHKVDASYGPVDTTMWAKSPAAGIHFSYRKAINGPSSGHSLIRVINVDQGSSSASAARLWGARTESYALTCGAWISWVPSRRALVF